MRTSSLVSLNWTLSGVISTLWIVWQLFSPAYSAESLGEAYFQQAKRDYDRGRYYAALELLKEVKEKHPNIFKDRMYAAVIDSNLAACYLKLSRDPHYSPTDLGFNTVEDLYDTADVLLNNALDLKEEEVGANSIAAAKGLENLACLYFEIEKASKAEALFRKAASIREWKQGLNSCDSAIDYLGLGDIYAHDGQTNKEAEDFYRKALGIWRRCYGASDIRVAVCHKKLALVFYKQNALNEAGKNYDRAEDIYSIHQQEGKPLLQQLRLELADVPLDLYVEAYRRYQKKKGALSVVDKSMIPELDQLMIACKRLGKTQDVVYLAKVLKDLQFTNTKPANKPRKDRKST